MARIFRKLAQLLDVDTTGASDGDALVYDDATDTWIPGAGGVVIDGAPTDATYLVTTANGDLDAEVVVGATPGGELGGTWASPTVDTTHSGSSHASVQAAAEATAAAALLAHTSDSSDAHDASAISSVAAGNLAATDVQAALNELDTEKAATSHAHAGEDITSGTVADARIASTIARDSEVTSAIATALAAADGAGLADNGSGVLSVNVDDSTIEISSDSLRVKDGGITAAKVAADVATQAELDAHVNDSTAAHAASAVSADSTTLVGTGTDVQAVLEELDNGIADHLADSSAAHAASAISFSPTGSIAATDVQAAIAEVASEASGIPTDGWIAAGETWTYASADDPTFTFTIAGVDLTGKYQAGQRVKLTQTTAKYFIITKVAFSTNTTITIYGGTDYDLANAAITSPYWSPVKAPFGFPLDPVKWTASATSSADLTADPAANTWVSPGPFSLDVPIGAWDLGYDAVFDIDVAGNQFGSLSTSNNSESDPAFTFVRGTGGRVFQSQNRRKRVVLTSKTTYYLIAKNSANPTFIDFRGDMATSVISAVCAYL